VKPFLLLCGLLLSAGATATETPQTAGRIELQVPYAFDYLIALPEGYTDEPDRRWPLLVFLHGAGERGRDLSRVARHGPPALIAAGRRFPAIVLSPQCPDDTWWNLPAVETLIDELARKLRVDQNRIYLTGLSMGGYAVWSLAQRRPDYYAAVVPICGGGDPRWAPRLRDQPLWAFHGARDEAVLPRESQKMIEAIRAAGGRPHFTLYPEAGHDAWTAAYGDEALWGWLFAQHRGNPASP